MDLTWIKLPESNHLIILSSEEITMSGSRNTHSDIISLFWVWTLDKSWNATYVTYGTRSPSSPAVKHHLTLHWTNVRTSRRTLTHTHANNNFTVRHSTGFCLPAELPFLTSREKFITAEPRHFKVTGPPGWRMREWRNMPSFHGLTSFPSLLFCILFHFL